ncbi:SWI/SNF and RSC complex subunit Ssr3 [Yamadazyma tenuis]|uniref:Subunit of SWI/SNF transcription activation complex n=1 Tax=Candida tenuis (strain ATCC 10573 / BCRC 21748 / CBS 615 / JCM 9827 / NBRC 10315 / NRRL Y-1498 / VKM Y-70) TaxID=590646 RepID=G3B153_CANTC|nr:subunit of SWI/SNF transcription activation complex [Yamadazyma tenuis ATCC 10573]EGV64882.1 subunit of SWI/SNF transcription activation complex [Yamadazyma tenuis ATCC 10573]WEJ97676.1 SWI/SNF and RSC complex subunit Ssr3 [Yamadazyma tenuis]
MATHQSIPVPGSYAARNLPHSAPGALGGPVPVQGKPRPNPAAAPAIQYTPNDLSIPAKLYQDTPNLEFYKKLLDAEREIDLISVKKELDFHVIHAKSLQPSSFKKETGTLRVYVYNTCENQPWQKQLAQQRGEPVDPAAEGFWTLKVEGKFLHKEGKEATNKFSSFLSGISVDLIINEDYPHLAENQTHVVEWRDQYPQYQQRQSEFDGFDVKRPGIFNLKCKIAILIKEQTARFKMSPKFSQFIGKEEATQQESIQGIWQYILFKGLITKKEVAQVDAVTSTTPGLNDAAMAIDTAKDLTVVKCDEVLQDLLGVEQFRFSELFQLIQPHFLPRQPIILDYEIDTRRSTTLGDLALDIPVELPTDIAHLQRVTSDEHKKVFAESAQTLVQIADLNSKIALGVSKLKNLDTRRDFYKELNENPVEFIKQWTKTQSETLKSLKSDEGYDEEVVRRAQYFEDHEDVLKEKIDVLLGTTKF